MKNTVSCGFGALLALAVGLALQMPETTAAQTGAPSLQEDPTIVITVEKLSKLNAELLANQALMEQKVAEIAEDVRQTKIFSARTGRGR